MSYKSGLNPNAPSWRQLALESIPENKSLESNLEIKKGLADFIYDERRDFISFTGYDLLQLMKLRQQRFGGIKLNQPVLVDHKNRILKYDMLRKFIKQGISIVSTTTGIKLNPKYYTPHSLRHGGCTDLSRLGAASYKVSIFGRWNSDCWKQMYVNIDFFDIAFNKLE